MSEACVPNSEPLDEEEGLLSCHHSALGLRMLLLLGEKLAYIE